VSANAAVNATSTWVKVSSAETSVDNHLRDTTSMTATATRRAALGAHQPEDLAVPPRVQSAAYFAATGSSASTTGAGHGPLPGLPVRSLVSRRV